MNDKKLNNFKKQNILTMVFLKYIILLLLIISAISLVNVCMYVSVINRIVYVRAVIFHLGSSPSPPGPFARLP